MKFKRREFLVGAAAVAAVPGCRSFRGKAPVVWPRLPLEMLPENVFLCLANEDFAENPGRVDQLLNLYGQRSSFNLITLSLRCRKDLSDPAVFKRVGDCAAKAKALGMQVHMDIDPRIARAEFLKRWPADTQREVVIATLKPVGDKTPFRIMADTLGDHMTFGTRIYEAQSGRIVSVVAMKLDAAGAVYPSSVRPVKYVLNDSKLPLTGMIEGAAPDETLAVVAEFALFSCDVFSPHLIPFVRELMQRYARLPIAGAMHDEWGFPPGYGEQMKAHRAFWYSPHYAAAYAKATDGRNLLDDYLLFAFPFAGWEPQRRRAIRAFMWLNFLRQKEIEEAFYENDKAIFGAQAYVTKHATWFDDICPMEYYHDGLSWWAAKRDWAQGDEHAPVPALTAMAKKFGGPCWLNEWYSTDPKTYIRNVWRYALAGGREIYHPIYGKPDRLDALPLAERQFRCYADLLTPAAVRAQGRVRLMNLISRGQLDCPVAVVFSHERIMDWSDAAWNDCGKPLMYGLWKRGYAPDAYPADEFSAGTFTIDPEGFLRVGQQRYTAVVFYRLSGDETARYDHFLAGRALKTKCFVLAEAFQPADLEPIVAALAKARAVKQMPPAEDRDRLPAPNGIGFLTDGTVFRISALTNEAGDPMNETLEGVAFRAQGLFAVRKGANGQLEALAAGGLTDVKAAGLNLHLDTPQDLALWKEHGHWRGVWQTSHAADPIPAAFQALTADWTRLLLPE